MIERVSDMTIVGLILTTLLFFGGMVLLYQIVTLNPVNPFSVYVVIFSILLGLGFGITAGWFFTADQLKILGIKGEYKLADSRKAVFAVGVGLPVFLLVSLLTVITGPAFAAGEIYFVLSAVFTMYIARIALIARFERQTKKVIMMDFHSFSGRFYIYREATEGARI
jgi:hypothetical protein